MKLAKYYEQNNLDYIMHSHNWTTQFVVEKTGLNRSTVYRIRVNPFHKLSLSTKNKIMAGLNVDRDELITKVSYDERIRTIIQQKCFDLKHVDLLKNIIFNKTKTQIEVYPYSNQTCINFKSMYTRKIKFVGNIRLSQLGGQLQLKIVDLDFNHFDDYLFAQLVKSFEDYSEKMQINYVVFFSNFLISDGINKKLTILRKLRYMFCDIDVRKVQFIKPKDIQEMQIDNLKIR